MAGFQSNRACKSERVHKIGPLDVNTDRWLCGWRVGTDLPLPELLPWSGDDRAPDVNVRLGEIPTRLPDLVHEGPLLQVAADGTCRYAIPQIAVYQVKRGCEIVVQPMPEAEAADVRVLLLGSVLGFLCHQRGLIPLHAGCVEIDGRAVALAGPSGVGKSTLTAVFRRRGHRILTDDVTVVDPDAAGGPMVLPAFPRLKLWRDALDGLGLSSDDLTRTRMGLDKFSLPFEPAFRREPLQLAAVVILDTVNDPRHADFRLLRGVEVMTQLTDVVYRRMMAIQAGRQAALMSALVRLAAIPVLKLSRVHDLDALDATAATIAARCGPILGAGAA